MTTEIFTDSYTLSNGVNIPKLGLGTWFIDDDKAAQAVIDAVGIGYRHIDTAQAYENERGIGEGVRKCGLARNDLFITSKLAAEAKIDDEAVRAIDETLAKMNIEYLDLMLIHSPQPWADFRGGDYSAGNRDAWRALEDAYKAGKLRAIGVSNFKQGDIDNILRDCTVKPMVNQLLVHISNTPTDLISYSQSVGMVVEAYSPIAHGKILDVPAITDMAKKYGVFVPQLCIRYTIQLGCVSLPKTANPAHMRDNAGIDFTIEDADMDALKNVKPIDNYGEFSFFPVFSGK